jgi:hypothetical protein
MSNNKKYIIMGGGLPRSGTTSLAEALQILGYEAFHYCQYTNINDFNPWCKCSFAGRAFVSASYTNVIAKYFDLVYHDVAYKLILCDRDFDKRMLSLENLGVQDASERWCDANAQICKFKEDTPANMLILPLHHPDKWGLLCSFLEEPIPTTPYPHVNKAEHNYQI